MEIFYGSLTYYSIVLFLVLSLFSEASEKCCEFIQLFFITAIACTTIGMLFPAVSAVVFFSPPSDAFHNIIGRPGAYHLEALTRLRGDADVVLDPRVLPGLVTFPSFHTAMGVVGIYCARHHPVLLGVSTLVNVVMIASTPLYGAHYGIDIAAGALVAGLAIACLRRSTHLKASKPTAKAL